MGVKVGDKRYNKELRIYESLLYVWVNKPRLYLLYILNQKETITVIFYNYNALLVYYQTNNRVNSTLNIIFLVSSNSISRISF